MMISPDELGSQHGRQGSGLARTGARGGTARGTPRGDRPRWRARCDGKNNRRRSPPSGRSDWLPPPGSVRARLVTARHVHRLRLSRIRPSGPRLHNPLEHVRRPRLPPDSAPIQTSWSGAGVPLRGADAVMAKDRRKTARNSRAGSLVTGDLGENKLEGSNVGGKRVSRQD